MKHIEITHNQKRYKLQKTLFDYFVIFQQSVHQNSALLSQATITRSSPPIAAHIRQVTNSEIVKTKSYTKWNMVPKTGKVKV